MIKCVSSFLRKWITVDTSILNHDLFDSRIASKPNYAELLMPRFPLRLQDLYGRLNVKLSLFNARQLSRRYPLQILLCILRNEWLSIACQANEEDILFMINVLVYIPTLNYVWYQNMKMHKPTMHRQYANTQMTIHVV